MVIRPASLALVVLGFALLGFLLPAPTAEAKELVEIRRIEQNYVPAESRAVRLDMSFGDIVVKGADREDIGIEIVLSCPSGRDQDKCRSRAERLVLEARNRTKHLALRLRRTPRARFHGIRADMVVEIPKDHNVEVDVRAGSVEISGLANDMEVDVGTGDTTIWYPQSAVGRVKATVVAGSAKLWESNDNLVEATGWPRSFTFSSNGQGDVEVDTGTGDVAVRLTDDGS